MKIFQSMDCSPLLPIPRVFTVGETRMQAFSRAAQGSYLYLPSQQICFDMGAYAPSLQAASQVFLTHTHDDHVLGSLRHCNLRRLGGMPLAEFFLPTESTSRFEALYDAFWNMKAYDDPRPIERPSIKGVGPGDSITLSKSLKIRVLPACHVIPTVGFGLIRIKHHLHPDFKGCSSQEIALAHRSGRQVNESVEELEIVYFGDHDQETLRINPEVGKAKVLFLECTFLGDHTRHYASRYKHLHLQELIQLWEEGCPALQAEQIVLKHFSARHQTEEIQNIMDQRLPPDLKNRVALLL